MARPTTKIPTSSIILDEKIYPRKGVDQKRVGVFAENIRDGFQFDPIEAQPDPDRPGKYRLLDGVHRWHAFKAVGMAEPDAIIIEDLDGTDPLLYAARKAIGPKHDLERIADRAAEICDIKRDDIFLRGKQQRRVKARSLFCYWAVRELGASLTELARRLNMSVPAVGYSVERGEMIADKNDLRLTE